MAKIMRFDEAAQAPGFRRVYRPDIPSHPYNALRWKEKISTRDGSLCALYMNMSGLVVEPETMPWGRCRQVIGEMLTDIGCAGLSGATNVLVHFLDEEARALGPEYCKVEDIGWNETGGRKGDRKLDQAGPRMAGRDIFRIVVRVRWGWVPYDWSLTPMPDDYVHLVRCINRAEAHFVCDDAVGGTEEAIRTSGFVAALGG